MKIASKKTAGCSQGQLNELLHSKDTSGLLKTTG